MDEIQCNQESATTKTRHDREMTFTAGARSIYIMPTDVDRSEILNQLNARLGQLGAMLHVINGDGAESLDHWSEAIKSNYLWGCSMLAEECAELAKAL